MPETTAKRDSSGGPETALWQFQTSVPGLGPTLVPLVPGLCGAPAGPERWGCLVFQTETRLPSANHFWLFIPIPGGWRRALPTPPPITQGRLHHPLPVLRGWDARGGGSCQESEFSH